MIRHANDILKFCDYAIIINSVSKTHYEVTCMMDNITYNIVIDENEQSVYCDLEDQKIYCEPYAYIIYINNFIKDICSYYDYPEKRIIYQHEGKKKSDLVVDFPETDETQNLIMIYQDILSHGLLPVHIILAKENEIWPEFKNVIQQIYGIEVND